MKVKNIEEYFNYFSKIENSIISDNFNNHMIYSYKCICGYISYRFQNTFDISLSIPLSKKENFHNIMKDNFKEELLEWISPCENCGEILSHKKEQKFLKLANYLIISFQKFSNFSDSLINTEIDFPDKIDLNIYCDKDYFKGNSDYNLFGIANHIDNRYFGLYFAFIKLFNKWIEFNDEQISEITKSDLSENYYYAIYIKN